MKKNKIKKPLLVCLTALTLFSATATFIVSSVNNNEYKTQTVTRIRRANEVNGAYYKLGCNGYLFDMTVNPSNSSEVMLTNIYFAENDVIRFKKYENVNNVIKQYSHGISLKDTVDTSKVYLNDEGLELTILESGYYSFYLDVSDSMTGYLWCSQDEAIELSNEVEGQFNVNAGLSVNDESNIIVVDITDLTSVELCGNEKFAVIFADIDEELYFAFNSGSVFPALGGTLADLDYIETEDGRYSIVMSWLSTIVGNNTELTIDFGEYISYENPDLILSDVAPEYEEVYGGYYGLTREAVITAANIPGMVEEDSSGPLISGSKKTYTTSVDSPISVETIKSALTAVDETDGDVTDSIVIKSDNYTSNSNKLGSYDVVFEASDKTGNKATLTVTIVVQDLVAPVIVGSDTQTFSYTKAKTLDDIKALYSVTDNYDTSLSIAVDSQSPVFDGTKVGTYTLVLSATDTSNHKVTKTITVNIVDDVAPVFSGSSSFVTNNATSASLDDIMSKCDIKATDAIDGECEVTIKSETLTGNADKVGNYEVVYQAQDSSGNISEFKVTVSITDGIPPVFYIDETIIYAANNISMTNVDLCNLMIATCEIDASKAYSLSITDTDGYLAACASGNEVPLGEYEVVATVSYKDGNKDVYTKTISVYDAESSDIETKEVKKNFFECFVQFFKNWKAAWDEGGFKLWWQKLWNGDLFKENMTKIVEVQQDSVSSNQ